MKRLLVWDIDGTLIDCHGTGRMAMNVTFERLYAIKNGFDQVSMAGKLDRAIVREAHQAHGLADVNLESFYQAYERSLEEVLSKYAQPEVLDGVIEILEGTHYHPEVFNVIATGNCQAGARVKLQHVKLDNYFTRGSYGDAYDSREALIRGAIEEARAEYGELFEPSEIYVIGDTPRDVTGGQQAGVKTIAVATGGYDLDVLKGYNPSAVLESLMQRQAFYDIIGVPELI